MFSLPNKFGWPVDMFTAFPTIQLHVFLANWILSNDVAFPNLRNYFGEYKLLSLKGMIAKVTHIRHKL